MTTVFDTLLQADNKDAGETDSKQAQTHHIPGGRINLSHGTLQTGQRSTV